MKRFTIASLMVLVLFCAVGVAALRYASDWWAGGLLLAAAVLLLWAVVSAVYRRGGRRAFWLGFAVFGWGYLLLALMLGFDDQAEPRLVTSQALRVLNDRMSPQPTGVFFLTWATTQPQMGTLTVQSPLSGSIPATLGVQPNSFTMGPTNRPQFMQIGHSLFALMFAFAGGLAARWLYATNRDRDDTPRDAPEPSPA